MKKNLMNWGQFPVRMGKSYQFSSEYELDKLWIQLKNSFIARGMGRCYGDGSLASQVLSTVNYSHLLDLDEEHGVLVAESGITLNQLLETLIPRGWFLPVTPGTSYVTLGGAVAADVHGKNHHCDGSFGNFISWFDLKIPSGEILRCSPSENSEIFYATIGGMGLTGLILSVALKLLRIETSWIDQKIVSAHNLEGLMDLFESEEQLKYSVAWIDCLHLKNPGHGVLMSGRHAVADELRTFDLDALEINLKTKLSVPCNLPDWFLSTWLVRMLNNGYSYAQKFQQDRQLVPLASYFYPLDTVRHWNRMYGSSGFIQYQCVLPLKNSKDGLNEILWNIQKSGEGSFLAVLKKFGSSNSGGWLSFPMEGYTLALDFPRRSSTEKLLKNLDEVVSRYGGRLYLAKDSRGPKDLFEQSYPRWSEFKLLRNKIDPNQTLNSDLAMRLGL
ncbi:MAG: FAD-binding oxidoreductase [bacterium]|nr:FAD-binding oxidoreductase [bacterium]